jgi:hypothetical protein
MNGTTAGKRGSLFAQMTSGNPADSPTESIL